MARAWEFWLSAVLGGVALVALALWSGDLKPLSAIGTLTAASAIPLLALVAGLWKSTSDFLRDQPIGEVVRYRDPNLDQVQDIFVIVLTYVLVLLAWSVVTYAAGDVLTDAFARVYLALGVWIGSLSALGTISVLNHWWRFHRLNSQMLAVREDESRQRRNS